MKKFVHALFVVALAMPVPAVLAQADMKGMDMGAKSAAGAPAIHKASGTVKKVDREANMVTLAHGPIQTLHWPAMTMAFKVRDRQLFEKLAVGRKVDVELVQNGKDYAVQAVK